MSYSKEELNEAYKKLPPELQEVFLSVDVTDAITNIGKKYNLHIDQIGLLDSETGLVLLGLTHPTEFVSSLTKRLGIDRIIASQVASDINDQVFLRVRELLKDIQKNKVKEEEEKEMEPRPSKDALLAALEHPEGMLKRPARMPEAGGPVPKAEKEIPLVEIKNPYQPAKPEMGKDFPVVAPVAPPKTEEAKMEEDILTQKMSGQFSLPKVETRVDSTPAKKIDPYKEQI